ncbi:FAD-dependent 5-carboxymethylaminomethyl-2-thiouridine(34) oxidoreductase MnmC [Betaproteobacteria bacterium LSUCC0115]|nr:FAD-dependent 5-carboxymethylaminomethyl-2-thiouridine(34) oxidoreductase MnmC [Burkholderiales bacterium LSUCC0115]
MMEAIKPPFCRSFQRIAVIGLGMAGACMVRALAIRGQQAKAQGRSTQTPAPQIVAFEAADQPATGASGNPVGIVHPFVSKDWNLASQFMQQGVQTTLRWVQELGGEHHSPDPWAGLIGVLQLAEDQSEAQAWQDLPARLSDSQSLSFHTAALAWLTPAQIQERLGLPDAPIGGLWSEQGGWIKPAELIRACLNEAKSLLGDHLTVHFNHPIQPEDLPQLQKDFDAVVICTAHDALLPWAGLRINKIAGQVSWIQHPLLEELPWPKAVVCRSGYLSPVIDGQVLVGATFDRDPSNTDPSSLKPTTQAHAENLQRVAEISPKLAQTLEPLWRAPESSATQQPSPATPAGLCGRVAIRHASHDRMPLIGQVISQQALTTGLPRSASQLHHLPREDKLYVMGGLGSRGLSIAPLAAERLAAQIISAPSRDALAQPLLDAVDPARFVLRAHRRAG